MTEDSRTWKDQYDLLMKIMIDEDTRFWQRFSVLAILNGGLVVAFSAFLGYMQQFEQIGTLVGTLTISIVGFITSVLWWKITEISLGWRKFYHDKIKKFEENMVTELRIQPQEIDGVKEIDIGSITKTSLNYPKIFCMLWIGLCIVTVIVNILSNGT